MQQHAHVSQSSGNKSDVLSGVVLSWHEIVEDQQPMLCLLSLPNPYPGPNRDLQS